MVNDPTPDDSLTRRERHKLETRQRLLAAALQLFCERGYQSTPVEDITDAADVAKGTFFNYFETKEAILPALADWRLSLVEEALEPGPDVPSSPVARIKVLLRLLAEDPLTNQLFSQGLTTVGTPEVRELHRAHPLACLLTQQVQQAQAAGEIRSDLEASYLGGIMGALFFHHMLTWHCRGGSGRLLQSLDGAIDLLMAGAAGPTWGRTT